jgi:hypothetical protein
MHRGTELDSLDDAVTQRVVRKGGIRIIPMGKVVD